MKQKSDEIKFKIENQEERLNQYNCEIKSAEEEEIEEYDGIQMVSCKLNRLMKR